MSNEKAPRLSILSLTLCLVLVGCGAQPDAQKGPGNGRGRGGGGGEVTPPPATILAASCNYSDVAAAVVIAVTGNLVQIPAGDCTWTQRLTIAKGITLAGAGVGQTIIRDGVQTGALLAWTCEAGKAHRVTGIEWKDGGRAALNTDGILRIDCTNVGGTTFRWDHTKLDGLNGHMLRPNTVVGVIDRNVCVTTARRFCIYVYDPNWNGTDDRWGDASWAAPVTWGGPEFLFVEDNDLGSGSCIDGFRGTRAVFRYNTLTDCHITAHGTESSGRNRGSRAVEIYKNSYFGKLLPDDVMANIRSGSALIWGNTATGLGGIPKVARLNQDRATHAFTPFGGADALNPWDINDTVILGPFTATASGRLTVSAAAAWPVDSLRGYTIRKMGCVVPAEANCFSVVQSNTFNLITFANSNTFGANLNFTVGSQFELRRVIQVLDGIGRGGGSPISGGTSGTAPARPGAWNDQYADPLYEWDNTGITVGFGTDASCAGTCRAGEHFKSEPVPGYTPYQYPHPLTLK